MRCSRSELAFFSTASRRRAGPFAHRGRDRHRSPTLTPDDLVETAPRLRAIADARAGNRPAARRQDHLYRRRARTTSRPRSRRAASPCAAPRVSRGAAADRHRPGRRAASPRRWLQEAWAARERASFALPPSRLALEPGDVVTLDAGTAATLRCASPAALSARSRRSKRVRSSRSASTPCRRPSGSGGFRRWSRSMDRHRRSFSTCR